MGVIDAARIPDGATVVMDTNPLIYWLEGNPLQERFLPVFEAVDAGRIQAVITPITLAEVVSGPLKAGRDTLARRYRHALCHAQGWSLRPMDADIAMTAAQLRIRHRLRLPDAIQLATVVCDGCHALVTHDRDFGDIEDLLILGVD